MALEVVWRNPVPQPPAVSKFELIELDRGVSIYVSHSVDAEVVLRIDRGQIYRPSAEVKRVGGA